MNTSINQSENYYDSFPFTPATGYDTVYLGKDIASLSSLNHLKIKSGLIGTGNLGIEGCASVVLGGLLLKNARSIGTVTAYAEAIFRIVQGLFQAMGGALYAASSFIKFSSRKLVDTLLTAGKEVSTVAIKVGLASRISFALGSLFFALGFGLQLHAVYKFREEMENQKNKGDLPFCQYLEELAVDPAQAIRLKRELGSEFVAQIQKAGENKLSSRLSAKEESIKEKAQREFEVLKTRLLELGAARKKILLVATVAATLFIGLTVATFFAFPHSVFVLAIVTLLAFSTMLILDMYRSLTNKELPGRHEGKYHLFVALSTLLIAAVNASCGFIPFALALIFGAVGIGTTLISYAKMKWNERVFKEENITIERFRKECAKRKGRIDGRILQLFKKLPKEEQNKIQSKWVSEHKFNQEDYYKILEAGKKNTDDFLLISEAMENLLKKDWSEEGQKTFDAFERGTLPDLENAFKNKIAQEIHYCDGPFKDPSGFFALVFPNSTTPSLNSSK